MFNRFIKSVFIFIFSVATCFSQEYVQNKNETTITFKIKNFGVTVEGLFKDIKFDCNFNPKQLKKSYLNADISVKSIFTKSKAMRDHLMKSDFFDVEKHPKIIFKSQEIIKNKEGVFIIKGDLNIKGIKKHFEVPLTIKEIDKKLIIKANFTLNRKDFNVGGSSLVLSKKVNVNMIYVAKRN